MVQKESRRFVPFFVVDRPVGLEILKGFFALNPSKTYGILTHAFTSKEFKNAFRNFPYHTKTKYIKIENEDEINKEIERNTIKLGDSGIFTGKTITYPELFSIYQYLKVDYGVIVDYYRDASKTVESARRAVAEYKNAPYNFKLVGVAQGRSVDEYLWCYEKLLEMGYRHIAIGGLLSRNGDSNYRKVKDDEFLYTVLKTIKDRFEPEWMFALGVLSPRRVKMLQELGVWADSKRWTFQYDEDYTFIAQYLPENKEIKQALENFVKIRRKIRRMIAKKIKPDEQTKKEFKEARQILEKALNKNNTSLQELRFRKVREELIKNFSIY